MWKKDEVPDEKESPRPASPRGTEARSPGRSSGERASIGRSITIKGDVTGDEDLLIQGHVDGSVTLEQHSVTVGSEGDVKASISGRVVTVEGQVKGDLTAAEQVVLRASAHVEGDIKAPRVVLEDGATFRGGIDMGDAPATGRTSGGSSQPAQSSSAPGHGKASPVTPGSSTTREKETTDRAAGVSKS